MLLLMHHLPPQIAYLWLGCDDMLTMLREGGLTSYTTRQQISDPIRTQKRFTLESNKYRRKNWFALHDKKDFPAPKQQLKSMKQLPQIEPNYFTKLGIKFKFIKTSKSQTTATNTTASTTATNNNPTTTASNNNNNNNVNIRATVSSNNNNNNNNNNNKTQVVTPDINKNTNIMTDKSTTQKKSTSSTPSIDPGTTGYMIASLSIFEDMLSATNDHQRKCGRGLQVTKMNRHGFDVTTKMNCKYCKRVYEIRNGPKQVDDPTTKKRPGPKTSQLNMTVTNAMHTSAIQIGQMGQFCMEVGCVAPSETGLHGMMSKRKEATADVGEETLRENRREHVRLSKTLNPERTIKHKDAEGKIHNICYGAVSADGAGDKRAYNHIITGSRHCTVVFSIITGRVLAIKHDQVSCGKCSRRLNKLLLEDNKRIEDITEDELKHEGTCYINSKHGPAVAEEHALEWLAEYLLIDPQTKKLRNDDEAILVDLFVADGDTSGR